MTTVRSVRPTTGDLVQFGGSVQLGRDECRRTHHVPPCRLRQRRRRYGAGRMSALALLDPAQARPDNELRFQVERSPSERSAEWVSAVRVVRRALRMVICLLVTLGLCCVAATVTTTASAAASSCDAQTTTCADDHGVDSVGQVATGCCDRSERTALRSAEARPMPTTPSAAVVATEAGEQLALGSGRFTNGNFAPGQLESHFAKHAGEWGAIGEDAYLARARSMLSSDVGGEIRGAVRANGDVLRYNVRTNEFAVGASDGTIRTLFRPTDGLDYWLSQVPK